MIKLNLTSEEFLALLNGLAKAIDLQPVSHEKLPSKVDTIRQYGNDDFMRLLDGLKKNELTEPSEWFQAIQYLYHHDEFQLVDRKKAPIDDQIRQILEPLDAALHRADMIDEGLAGLLAITLCLCFFVFNELLPWWEWLLYTVVSLFPIMILITRLPIRSIWRKMATRLALNSFFELFPKEHPDFYTAINRLKVFEAPNEAGEILYKAIQSFYPHDELQLVDREKTQIDDQIRQILVPLDAALYRAKMIGSGSSWLSLIIFILCFFVFYEFPWWKSLSYTVVSLLPAAMITALALSILKWKATRLALNSFLELFPKEHPDFYTAINRLEVFETPNDAGEILSEAIQYFFYHNDEFQLVDERERAQIEDKIRQILVPLDAALHRAKMIARGTFLLLLITLILCFFVFYEFPWWKSLLYTVVSVFPAGTIIIALPVVTILQGRATRLALNSFFELFPKEHPSFHKAINRLTEFKTPNNAGERLSKALLEKRLEHAYALFDKGDDAYDQGDFRIARDAWAACLKEREQLTAEDYIDLRDEIASTRMNYGICLMNLGDLPTARSAYEQCLNDYETLIAEGRAELRPDLALTRMNYGICLRHLGDLPTARRVYEQCLNDYETLIAEGRAELPPDLARTRMNYGTCLWNLGDLPTARCAYEQCLNEYETLIAEGRAELRQDLASTRMNYGICLYSLGDLPTARRTYEQCLNEFESLIAEGRADLRDGLAKARTNYGICLDYLGEIPTARRAYEQTLQEYDILIAEGRAELRPDLAHTRINYGVCLENLGELPTARRVYEQTINEYETLIAEGRAYLRYLAVTRMNYGICLRHLGDLPTARRVYEQCLNDYETLIAEGRADLRPSLALTRMNYGGCLLNLGDLPTARRAYEQTLNDYQTLIAEGRAELRPSLALTRMGYGSCLLNLGDLPTARRAYEQTLNEYETLIASGRAELRPDLARTRMNYGNCLAKLGDLPTARCAFEQCLNEYETLIAEGRAELRPKLALTRMGYGNCLLNLGDLPTAHRAYEQCLNEFETLIADGRAELRQNLARTRVNYGICLKDLGDLPTARCAYEQTLNEYETLIASGRAELRPDLARTRMNYGNCLTKLGDLPTARCAFEQCLNEYETLIADGRPELRPELALTRMDYGNCLNSQGDLPTARRAYEQCLNEYETLIADGRPELRQNLAQTGMNYGICLAKLGDLPTARCAFEQCLNEYETLIADGRAELRPDLALTRMNYGNCLNSQGDLPTAHRAYEQCLSQYQTLIAEGRPELLPYLVRARMNTALLLKNSEDYAATEKQYQTSRSELETLQKAGQLFPDAIGMVRVIANWYRHPQRPQGADKPAAFELAKQGLDWLDILLNRISDAGKNLLLERQLPLFHLAAELALELNQPTAAYHMLERSKSRVLVEQMLREMAEPGPQVAPELRQQYQQLRQKLRQLVYALGTPLSGTDSNEGDVRFLAPSTRTTNISPEQEQQLLQTQQDLELKLQQVRSAIAEQDRAFGEAIQPRSLTEADIKALIPAETLVIAFEQRPEFLRLYAITAQGVQRHLTLDNLPSQRVDERVEAFKIGMTKKSIPRKRKALTQIEQWLNTHLKPALTELTAQFQPSQLILIPHVSWHLLPIHLVTIDDKPLAVRYPLRYLPSLQILRLITQRPPARQGNGCIIANPGGDLLGAEQESQIVYQLRGQIDKLLARQDAHLSAVRDVLNNSQHGHFSCHGYFAADLKAGLQLADGDLIAKEMFTSIRMNNPRLVVMSACETAQIQPTLGDEYMGLSASFLFAGAHNVLATQWRVHENASRLLIEDFYQGLNEGLSPVHALQQAQRQLREMSKKTIRQRSPDTTITRTYEHPYYWAGFVLIGDGE
jgi:tetratricopeptide (TPR) repeat protein